MIMQDIYAVGITGNQTRKVMYALLRAREEGGWVNGWDLVLDYNHSARNRISELNALGFEIESRPSKKNRFFEYRLTEKGYDYFLERLGAKNAQR